MRAFVLKNTFLVGIVCILLVGIGLRLYQLGSVPTGLGWDEAAIGYNGWSVWTTRRDEWLNRLPFSFRSFGDYKAPLAIYLNGPFTLLFGMNAFAVRLPFFLFACATLVVWWRLLELIRRQLQLSQWFVAFGVAILVFSPWHFVFSRIAFESVISLFFVVFGVWMTLAALESQKRQSVLFLLAGLSFVASLYAYHSAKIVVPMLMLTIAILWRKELLSVWKKIAPTVVVSVLALIPLLYDAILGQGATRAGDLVFMQLDSAGAVAQSIVGSISAHLNPSFLLLGQGDELRHVVGSFGVIAPGTLAFMAVGLWHFYSLRGTKGLDQSLRSKYYWLSASWVFIGFLPGFLSVVFPHANRTLLALPGLVLLASFGFEYLVSQHKKTASTITSLVLGTVVLVDMLWSVAFFNVYFTSYPEKSSASFQAGYQQAVAEAKTALSGENSVDSVLFSSKYGQPYIYVLFFNKISPISYHQGALVQYLFPDQLTIGDTYRENSLLIFTDKDPVAEKLKELPAKQIDSGTQRDWFFSLETNAVTK